MPYRLSVCVPTYNRRIHLISLYESIVNQQFNDIQLVITDDGSTDDTSEVISSWKKNNAIPIKYIYQENAGRPTALRKALMEATGEFTVIMDDDDLFVPDAFELIKLSLDTLSKNECRIRVVDLARPSDFPTHTESECIQNECLKYLFLTQI